MSLPLIQVILGVLTESFHYNAFVQKWRSSPDALASLEDVVAITPGSDLGQLSIEDRLKQAEISLKEAEVDLKRAELRQRFGWHRWLTSPVTPVVITAIAGFVVAQVTANLQSTATLQVEREKLKSSLILKVIETGDQEVSATNLLFLYNMGLIDDPKGKIAGFKEDPTSAPVLSSPNSTLVPSTPASQAQFFERFRKEFGRSSPTAQVNLTQIMELIGHDKSVVNIPQAAYILATIYHETDGTFGTLRELGRGKGKSYGTTYYGRGYLQLTGEDNYRAASEALGLTGTSDDLVTYPDRALDPQISYRITSWWMLNGLGNGRRLDRYINAEMTDYVNARKVISGLDKANVIASYANKFETILRESITATP